jgi:hypothetical protein
MGYFETNLNMVIAFKAKYLYNVAIPTCRVASKYPICDLGAFE